MACDSDGGPAFPRTEGYDQDAQEGMTLRDWFAGQAIPTATKWEEESIGLFSERVQPTYDGIASRAYSLAKAMLKERAK